MFRRRAYSLVFYGALVLGLVHCSADTTGPLAPGIVAVSLTPPTATLRVGTVVQLAPTVTIDGAAAKRDVSYVSSDPIVVDVSPTGLLRALNVGTANVTAIVGDTSATVAVTVIAGLPKSVVKRVGDEQTAPAGNAVPIPPAVTVLDSAGNPVSGVSVTFSGTGVIQGVSATTNDIGVAVVTTWTLAKAAGPNTLTATVDGLAPVTFTATGTAAAIGLSAASLAASGAVGSGSGAVVQSVDVTNAGTGTLAGLSLGPITFTGSPGWLTASIAAATAPTRVTLTASPAGLPVGTYVATVPVLSTNATNALQPIVFTLTITPAASATTLASSSNPSILGKSVSLTATVTASGVAPTGTVQFKDGGVALGAPVALVAGSATLTTSALSIVGSPHVLTAEYSGDGNVSASTSAAVNQVVGVASTVVTLASNVTAGTFGTPVTFSATVTGSGGTPTGTVEFRDGGTVLGSAVLNAGVATFTTAALSIGGSPHLVTAIYAGDSNNGPSLSSVVSQNVTSGAPSVATLTSSGNPSAFGQAVTFTATVTGPGGTPTGTVTFKEGATTLGSGVLSSAGIATLVVPTLNVSAVPHALTVNYSGDATYASSVSAAVLQAIAPASTSTALSSSAPSVTSGQPVTFTATVTSQFGAATTGSVAFSDGGTTLGTAVVNGGVATYSTSALSASASPHSITAAYGGDANNSASTSAVVSQSVNAASSSVTLTSNLNPSAFASAVIFTATVTGSFSAPTGSVTFKDGSTTIGTAAANASGIATFTSSLLGVVDSPHAITATYAGDGTYASSTSAPLSQVVTRASTSTSLTSSATTSTFGQAVTFTATTTSAGGTPSGVVTFKDGTVTLGSSSLSGGKATFTTTVLAVSDAGHSVTAIYGGAPTFDASTSASLTQVVAVAQSGTTLTSSANPAVVGETVTLTVVVAGPGGSPAGSVTFKDGETTLGTSAIDGSGTATFTSSALALGAHTVTAVYGGDGSYASSNSAALIQTIGKATPSVTVSSPSNTATFGQSVTFTATIAGALSPSGTVTFKDGAADLSGAVVIAGGVATFTTSQLPVDGSPHEIVAVYGGDANYLATSSAAAELTVTRIESVVTLGRTYQGPSSESGTPVTFLAIIKFPGGLFKPPTGTVQFLDNGVNIGAPVTITRNGTATLSTVLPSTGTAHTITAVYTGDTNYKPGTSNSVVQSP